MSNEITFKVDDVKPGTINGDGSPFSVHLFKGRKIEACADVRVIPMKGSSLANAVAMAYNDHLPLRLTPDVIWMQILYGLARAIEQDPEVFRKHFVQHEGKKELIVRRDGFRIGAENNWAPVFGDFSSQIAEHVGDKHKDLVGSFSTSSDLDLAATSILIMDTMQSYFHYTVMTKCGFPEITLVGTPDDYKEMRRRVQAWEELPGLSWWTTPLLEVLDQLVYTACGRPDKNFWGKLYRETRGSGGTTIDGWLTVLFPYVTREKWTRENGQYVSAMVTEKSRAFTGGRVSLSDLPEALGNAPVTWDYMGQKIDLEVFGGLVGVGVDEGKLTPRVGWAVLYK